MSDFEIRQLERYLNEYKTIFAAMPVMLWYKDNNNVMIRINDAAAKLEGVDPAVLEGKSSWDVYPKEQADAFWADDREVLESGQPKLNIVERHVTPKGEEMWVHTNKVPTYDSSGHVNGVIAIAIDVTEREKARAELEQKNRELERVRELIQSTLDHIQDAAGHGADRDEILAYIATVRKEFERIDD